MASWARLWKCAQQEPRLDPHDPALQRQNSWRNESVEVAELRYKVSKNRCGEMTGRVVACWCGEGCGAWLLFPELLILQGSAHGARRLLEWELDVSTMFLFRCLIFNQHLARTLTAYQGVTFQFSKSSSLQRKDLWDGPSQYQGGILWPIVAPDHRNDLFCMRDASWQLSSISSDRFPDFALALPTRFTLVWIWIRPAAFGFGRAYIMYRIIYIDYM